MIRGAKEKDREEWGLMQENRENQCHDEYCGSRGCLEALCREPWRRKIKCILAPSFTREKRTAAIYQHSSFRLCPYKLRTSALVAP